MMEMTSSVAEMGVTSPMDSTTTEAYYFNTTSSNVSITMWTNLTSSGLSSMATASAGPDGGGLVQLTSDLLPQDPSHLAVSYSQLIHNKWPYLLLFTLVLGCVVANVLVVAAIISSRVLHRTVFYLLASLAVADTLHAALVLSPSLTYTLLDGCWWPGYWCHSWLGLEGLLGACTLSHLCLAVCDSHAALLRPLQYQLRQVHAYAVLNVATTWLLALILTVPLIVLLIIITPLHVSDSPHMEYGTCLQAQCTLSRPEHVITKVGVTYLLPAIVLMVLCILAHRAMLSQANFIVKMQAEANSMTTSNGDVTGLDRLEQDLVSEKTITQTIDICCQLAGVGPISKDLASLGTATTSNGHVVPDSPDNQEDLTVDQHKHDEKRLIRQQEEDGDHHPTAAKAWEAEGQDEGGDRSAHCDSADAPTSEPEPVHSPSGTPCGPEDGATDQQPAGHHVQEVKSGPESQNGNSDSTPGESDPTEPEKSSGGSERQSPCELPIKRAWQEEPACKEVKVNPKKDRLMAMHSQSLTSDVLDTPCSEVMTLTPEVNGAPPGLLNTMHQYYYSTFDEGIRNPEQDTHSTVQCVAEVHTAGQTLQDEEADIQQEPAECDKEGTSPGSPCSEAEMALLPIPAENAIEASDVKYGLGTPPNTPSDSLCSMDRPFGPLEGDNEESANTTRKPEKLTRKKSKEILNEPSVEVADITLSVPATEQLALVGSGWDPDLDGMENAGFEDYAMEDETPLATSIQVVHCPLLLDPEDGEQVGVVYTRNGHLSHPPTRQPSRSSLASGTSSCQDGPHRSILRRDASTRSTVRKSVKFASTVSTKEIRPRAANGRVPSGRKRVQRQGSLKNPNRVNYSRQNSISADTADDASQSVQKSSKKKSKDKRTSSKEERKSKKKDKPADNNPLSVLTGLQMSGSSVSGSPTEYLAELHQRQGQRMTLRVRRQRSTLRLVLTMVFVYVALTLPHHVLQVVLSLCPACHGPTPQALVLTLQWLAHAVCIVNPLIYVIISKDFRAAMGKVCSFCCGGKTEAYDR